jgi:hypothetical protein
MLYQIINDEMTKKADKIKKARSDNGLKKFNFSYADLSEDRSLDEECRSKSYDRVQLREYR